MQNSAISDSIICQNNDATLLQSSTYNGKKRRLILVLMLFLFAACFSLMIGIRTEAKTTYPVIENEGSKAKLNKSYSFEMSNAYTSENYAYIYKNGYSFIKQKLPEYSSMNCMGKYGDKFYFNVQKFNKATAVYSYKPGDKKFKLVCKNLNLNFFKKSYTTFRQQQSGIMGKRYILARDYYPTDWYAGYGNAYVFDLKTNKKVKLDSARDIIWIGKNIYWTTTTPVDWAKSKNPRIVVRSANVSGKNIKTIKTVKSKYLKQSNYGGGRINKHYAEWNLLISIDRSETIKIKYR